MMTQDTPPRTVQVQSVPDWSWGLIFAIFLLAGMALLVRGCSEERTKTQAAEAKVAAEAQQTAQYAMEHPKPISECTTPCSMYVDWGQRPTWPEEHPINIKFAGMDWITVPAMGKEVITFSQRYDMRNFKAGDAKFDSPDGLSLLVQIYNK